MIQDIKPHSFNNHFYSDRVPEDNDYVISYHHRNILVKAETNTEKFVFPKFAECKNKRKLIYLFSIDDERFFLDLYGKAVDSAKETDSVKEIDSVRASDNGKDINSGNTDSENEFEYVDVRKLRTLSFTPKRYIFAAFTAMHLAEWYMKSRFCGKCGFKLQHDSLERAMRCDGCGEVFYPRINPAVIVGVINQDKLLITRYRKGYGHNALVAGFTEIGETLEETVKREVLEETGLQVKNIRYYKSQPWGIASDLPAGFFCEVDGDSTIHMDREELRYAEWVERPDIELQPRDYSLTNEMMKLFKEGKEQLIINSS